MEIEARYAIPDKRTFNALRTLDRLGHFRFLPQEKVRTIDHYLDTERGDLMAKGWACRLRSEDGVWYVTLKGPRVDEGPIASRMEWEFPLEHPTINPAEWPHEEVSHLVPSLSNKAPLSELAVVNQTRRRYGVVAGARFVAEASLDELTIDMRSLHHRSYVLECEIAEQGQRSDLERFDSLLNETFDLEAERLSKLQKALWLLELSDARTPGHKDRITTEGLVELYQVPKEHTDRLTHMVEVLYNGLEHAHGLAPWHRPLARTASQLCTLGRILDYRKPHVASRDIILARPIEGLDAVDRAIVAAAAYLHRGKITKKRIKRAFPKSVDAEHRQDGLKIAALVRMVASLNYSSTERTAVERIEPAEGKAPARIILSGPRADRDAKRAARRSDLWSLAVGPEPIWQALTVPPEKRLGLETSDSMREAGVKVLSHHFDAMLKHEPGTRQGTDPEELHDMRVATRRMRAALRLFGDYMVGDAIVAVNDALRTTGRVLGRVRNLDVDIDAAEEFVSGASEGNVPDLSPLQAEWARQREAERQQMLAYLDSRAYSEFLEAFHVMLSAQSTGRTRNEGAPPAKSTAARYIALYWQGVLGYGKVMEGAPMELLHRLRIDCKRLRYTLEFFQELLGPDATRLAKEMTRAQDHLGLLNDARTSTKWLDDLLQERSNDPVDLSGTTAYRDHRRLQIREAVRTLPKMWKALTRKSVRQGFRRLADVV